MRICILLAAMLFVSPAVAKPIVHDQKADISVAFSPNQGAAKVIVTLIDDAKKSIRVAAYSFTSKEIAQALTNAHKRGVDVQVVLDKSNGKAKYTAATFLVNAGIPTRINNQYAIMHNKFMVMDGATVQTGSFNYTNAAENRNAENVVVIKYTPHIAKAYTKEWQKLWDESEAYERLAE